MRRILATTALVISGALPAQAFEIGAMTDEQREIFRQEVRSYLLENPEVIMEAVEVLQSREADAARDADSNLIWSNADALFNSEHDWVGGNPDGDFTVVEFMDYRCGYCRRAHPEVAELIESDGNIRIIVKEFPILGPASELSSRFAIATRRVAGDDAYKDAYEALITLDVDASDPVLRRLADELGLDTAAIMDEMNSDAVTQIITENRALAEAMNISGTPSFVFEDTMVRGYVPLDNMQRLVRQIRAQEG